MTTLYVTKRAWEQIEQAVREQPAVETGGILMGFRVRDGDWVIAYASGPGPKAIHERRAISFDDPYLRKLARKVRLKSASRLQYIGDWHSHTVRRLTPSKGDLQTVFSKAKEEKYASPSPLMLIVGLGRRNRLQARGYILIDGLREIERIELIEKTAHLRQGQTPS